MVPDRKPEIMGILNVTPDSFSDGGRFDEPQSAIVAGLTLTDDGADIIDIGAESTRPGAEVVPVEEEMRRALPVVAALAKKTRAIISIDTRKPAIARAAIEAGASIWNDVSALSFDPASLEVAASLTCKIVLMHAQGDPRTMQNDPHYDDVVEEVYAYLAGRIEAAVAAGVHENRLIIDPGIGFGKTLDHNLALMAQLRRFTDLGRPVLVGASRKRFIAALDREGPADRRLGGSIAAALGAAAQGAAILRVHDVPETRQALAVFRAIG